MVLKMATKSFYEGLRIETEEQVQILLRAFEEADNRIPEPPRAPSIEERLAEGTRLIREWYSEHLIRDNASE